MNRVIIISKNQKASEFFEKFLIAHKIRDITHVSSSSRARRAMSEHVYDLAIIVSPILDENGETLAREISATPETQVMFFAKDDLLSDGEIELARYGIITQTIPINRPSLEQGFRLAYAFSKKMRILISKTKDLQIKLAEIKKIDLAKCYIIEMEGKSEEEAHKTIEKLAMDKRKTKLQIATDIIEKYRA